VRPKILFDDTGRHTGRRRCGRGKRAQRTSPVRRRAGVERGVAVGRLQRCASSPMGPVPFRRHARNPIRRRPNLVRTQSSTGCYPPTGELPARGAGTPHRRTPGLAVDSGPCLSGKIRAGIRSPDLAMPWNLQYAWCYSGDRFRQTCTTTPNRPAARVQAAQGPCPEECGGRQGDGIDRRGFEAA
jgi:hypothetical protein